MALGGVLFLALLARPLAPALGAPARADPARHACASPPGARVALVLCEAATVALQTAVLVGTVDLPVGDVLAANFAVAGLVKTAAAGAAAGGAAAARRGARRLRCCLCWSLSSWPPRRSPRMPRPGWTTARRCWRSSSCTSSARRSGSAAFRASCWRCACARDGAAWRRIGARFSRMSMAGVGLHRGQRHHHVRRLYRRLAGLLRHRLRRDGRRQDRHAADAAGRWAG